MSVRLRCFWKGQYLSLVVFLIALFCFGIMLFMALSVPAFKSIKFIRELFVLLAISTFCSLTIFLIESVLIFGVSFCVQLLLFWLIALTLPGGWIAVDILLLIPYLLTSAAYLPLRIGITVNLAVTCVITVTDALRLTGHPIEEVVAYIASLLVVSGAIGGFSTFMLLYREKVIDLTKTLDAMVATVTKLSNANRAFQLYADTIELQSRDDERNLIARELHDVIGYALTNIAMGMNAGNILLRVNSKELPRLLEETRHQAEDALVESRKILHRLRSMKNAHPQGLKAVFHMCRTFQEVTGIKVNVNYGNLPWTLGDEIDDVIYRFIQEGLTNAIRHGQARSIRINFWQTESEIRLAVVDDGKGLMKNTSEGIGLTGMRERFASVGGQVNLANAFEGCELRGVIPFRRHFHAD